MNKKHSLRIIIYLCLPDDCMRVESAGLVKKKKKRLDDFADFSSAFESPAVPAPIQCNWWSSNESENFILFFAFHVIFRQRHERRSINDEKEHNEKEGGITTMLMAYIIINHMISRTTFSCRIGHSISIIVWDWKRMR